MIFVTVGTQLPFTRMIGAVDAWAAINSAVEVFAQIGPEPHPPRAMEYAQFLPPGRVEEMIRQADLVVSHAGMGSVLTALRHRRPILIMPRSAGLGEHRNDHQLATARWLQGRPGISVAWDEAELQLLLADPHAIPADAGLAEFASGGLVDRLKHFICDGAPDER